VLDSKAAKDEPPKLVAVSVPTDLPIDGAERFYAVLPRDRIGARTRLKITYVDSTRLVSSVGVEVEDTRLKMIAEIAGVIIAGAAGRAVIAVARAGQDPTS